MDIVYSYTRKQAIQDGVQVKLTDEQAKMAKQLYKYPVFLTSGVFNLITLATKNEKYCNDFNGVLWDILWMSQKMSRRITPSLSQFQVIITGTGRKRYHTLLIECGPTDLDDPAPSLTIMLPEER